MQKKGAGFSPCGTLFGEKASFSRFSAACEARHIRRFCGTDQSVPFQNLISSPFICMVRLPAFPWSALWHLAAVGALLLLIRPLDGVQASHSFRNKTREMDGDGACTCGPENSEELSNSKRTT
jgi:hypothetical protein